MIRGYAGFFALSLVVCLASHRLNAQNQLVPELQPLLPYLDKTWKANVGSGPDNQPFYDISRWERALNGRAVRVLHSVADGEYGGETIIMWDPSKKSLVFYYFTTAGFLTHGMTSVTSSGLRSVEEVVGNDDGITRVESTSSIADDGTMVVISRMLKKGKWQESERVVYSQDPDAEIIFR